MSDRRSTGKRLRFEILKRDGFACRYCGADAATSMLHIDHVVPLAEDGSDEPENLITACAACNLGKSSVPLDRSQLEARPDAQSIREHAEQVLEYLDAVKKRDAAMADVCMYVESEWSDQIGKLNDETRQAIFRAVRTVGLVRSLEAVKAVADAVARQHGSLRMAYERTRYFCAVIRNMRRDNGLE